MNTEHELVGQMILDMWISNDKHGLKLNLANGAEIIVGVGADCCSYTWIEHVELPALGFPAMVTAVEDLFIDGSFLEPLEYLQKYACKISTDKGEILIDFRNMSNGYYGGWLEWPYPDTDGYGPYSYKGVYGQAEIDADANWNPLKEM